MITGFPIVTQKRSSYTIQLPRRDLTKPNHEIASTPQDPSLDDPTFLSNKDDIIVPLSLYHEDIQQENSHAEFSVTQSNQTRCFTAIMNIQYYHIIRRTCIPSNQQEQVETTTILKTKVYTVAEVQIIISPWSSDNIQIPTEQKQSHRFVCSTLEMEEERNGTFDEILNSSSDVQLPKYTFDDIVSPQLTFSENGKYLACIVPRPIQQFHESSYPPLSLVAIFPLTPPTVDGDQEHVDEVPKALPQPSYLPHQTSLMDVGSNCLPPSIGKAFTLRISPDVDIDELSSSTVKWISQIVSIADYSFAGLHLLLGGCSDGSLVVINYKRATLLGCIFTPRKPCGIRDLQCFKHGHCIQIGVVYSDGRVEMYKSEMNVQGTKTVQYERNVRTYHDLTCNIKYNPFRIRTWLLDLHLSPKLCSGLKFDRLSFVNECTIATLVRPFHIQTGDESNNVVFDDTIAQVWSFDPTLSNAALLSSLKMDNDMVGNVHDDETTGPFCFPKLNQFFSGSIAFDSRSNCILISSALPCRRSTSKFPVRANAFVTIWDWQTASTGIILPCSVDTVRCVCKHKLEMFWDSSCAYLLREYASVDKFTRHHYHVALLSPSRYVQGRQGLRNPNPLLLEHDCVAYPSLLERTALKDWQVQWKYAKIPSNYIENNGCVKIAIIGERYGKTLVLVGSTGICVLSMNTEMKSGIPDYRNGHIKFDASCQKGYYCDLNKSTSRYIQDKWSMFRRRDERKVEIVNIALWENYTDKGDDLIIAIARYRGHSDCKDSDTFLVAWSSGSIDLKRQLLVPFNKSTAVKMQPTGIQIHSEGKQSNQNINVLHSRRRNGHRYEAALLVTDYDGDSLSYQIFKLTATEDKKRSNEQVVCADVVKGKLNESIFGMNAVFLARYSFTNNHGNTDSVATIGVINNHGTVLSSFSVNAKGQKCSCKVFDSFRLKDASKRLIQLWCDDTFSSESTIEENWTWNMVLSDGSLLAWNTNRSKNDDCPEHITFHLHRSLSCGFANDSEHPCEECDPFGTISTENECISCSKVEPGAYLLGPLPSQTNRHLLYVCQKFQMRRHDGADMLVFGVSDFDVGIPSSASALLLLLSNMSIYEMSAKYLEAEALMMDLVNTVRCARAYESTFSSLRTIAAFLTDLFLHLSKKARMLHQKRVVLKSIQSQVVRVAMHSLVHIQFASLFLGVGRQLEAHHFEYLYPLALSSNISDDVQELTLQQIFAAAVNDGSFSIPAGALPLIPDQQLVHTLCINLLHHAICTILCFKNPNSVEINCMREEVSAFRQLFLYSLKLEDSRRLHISQQINLLRNINDDEVSLSYDRPSAPRNLQPQPAEKVKNFISLLNPFQLTRKYTNECQISEAASSFILTGYGDENNMFLIGPESSISDESDASYDSFIQEEIEENDVDHTTSCLMLSMAITCNVFLKTASLKNGLRNITIMCTLMRTKAETISNIKVKTWLCDLKKEEFLDLMTVRRNIFRVNQSSESLLKVLLNDCEQSWNCNEANAVACGIHIILSNSDHVQDFEIFFTGLRLLLLVALHVSRDYEILDTSSFKSSDLGKIYHTVNEERLR